MTGPLRPTEDELIASFFAPIAGEGGLGLRDDAALLRPREGHDLVVTVDAVVSGVHFFVDDPAAAIGRKALAVNMSDLAAKGALPVGFVLSLALPDDWRFEWLRDFAEGLREASVAFGCPLLGGDTVRANGALAVSITALGETPRGTMVHRFGARAGDHVCVSGTIGDSALGLMLRKDPGADWTSGLALDKRVYLVDRYLHPRPRLALARVVREHANAAMDVSDGLAGDLAKMAHASGLSARIDLPLVPLSTSARRVLASEPALIDRMLTGGDDYEILCSVPEERLAPFLEASTKVGVPVCAIGTMVEGSQLPVFRDGDREKRYEIGSFRHF